ncbi:Smr/MutS family protein [Acetobacter sp.]|uniref:Smr/MutS family protein n=1 Tax=Acetobacter sp. TaxID=440 RepID=UPI0039E7A69D
MNIGSLTVRRRRGINDEERTLWSNFVRGVTPLARSGQPTVPLSSPRHKEAGQAARQNAESLKEVTPAPPSDPATYPAQSLLLHQTRSMAFMTPGELAVAAHLRGKISRKKHTVHPAPIGTRQAGLDTGSWNRLSRGHTLPERKLDLHGMTAQAAFLRLYEFLSAAYRADIRCVEIVTGLGSGPEGGVLKRELPFWLDRDDLRGMVLAVTHSHAANHGAVRLLLKKRRHKKRR